MSAVAPVAYAAILAGGGGTRLWPASRRSTPKQLLTLGGSESLLAAAVRRAEAAFGRDHVLVITAADQAGLVRAAVPELPPAQVLAEPVPRNTAPAVGLAAAYVLRAAGPEAVLAVLPADAFIGREPAFTETLRTAVAHARETIVTIGIKPTHPETGFGYVKAGAPAGPGARAVDRFVEKPDRATAEGYLAHGDYLWNSGMFFLTAGRMRKEAEAHLPKLAAFIAEATGPGAPHHLGFERVLARDYPNVESISIDYGIMEKATGLRVVPGDFGWNDVGSWSALRDIRPRDAAGNVVVGDAQAFDSEDSILVSEPGGPFVAAVGVRDLVVVATADGVLVLPRDRAQDVRMVVEHLKTVGRTQLL